MKFVAGMFASLLILMGSGAWAEAVSPEQAAEMLAHAWMIDNRCNVLGNDERDALTTLVARAELALAEKKSVTAARNAIGRGRASGTAAPCNGESAQSVRDVFEAAQSATAGAALDMPASVAAPVAKAAVVPAPPPVTAAPASVADDEAPETVALVSAEPLGEPVVPAVVPRKKMAKAVITEPRTPQKPAKVAMVVKKARPAKPAPQNTTTASGYAVTAEAYYKELRCRTKSGRAMNAMYSIVLRQHRAAIASQGKAAVRALLRAAEARAARGSC